MSDVSSPDKDTVLVTKPDADAAAATPGPLPPADEAASTAASQHQTDTASPELPTGAHCVTDRPTPSGQASTGEIIKLNEIDVYISKPADYPHTPSRLLLLLTGGTGIHSINNQLQADRYASEGFLVLMPDMFAGDAGPGAPAITEDSTSMLERIKLKAAEMAKSFVIDMWLARITPDRVMPILRSVIDAAREQYGDAVRAGDGIYAVGYCVGGRFVVLLAQEQQQEQEQQGDEESARPADGPLIKAGAVAHAASVIPDDFVGIKAPLSFVCVEDDPLFPDAVRAHGEKQMAQSELEHEVHVYPGVPHGFAVVGEYTDSSIRSAQATAYEQMLKWVKEH